MLRGPRQIFRSGGINIHVFFLRKLVKVYFHLCSHIWTSTTLYLLHVPVNIAKIKIAACVPFLSAFFICLKIPPSSPLLCHGKVDLHPHPLSGIPLLPFFFLAITFFYYYIFGEQIPNLYRLMNDV